MASIEFNIKLEGFDNVIAALNPSVPNKALVRTLKEIGSNMKTKSIKMVRETYAIKAAEIKQGMRIQNPSSATPVFMMFISGKRLSLSNFRPKQTKKGTTVLVNKKKGRKLIKHAFVYNGAVFAREGKSRLPINKLSTIPLPNMFHKDIVDDVTDMAKAKWDDRFAANFEFYLGKV